MYFQRGPEEKAYFSDEDDFPWVVDVRNRITIDAISEWINTTGKHQSRLAWYEACMPDSVFYTKIAKPFISLRTTGSITVERVANLKKTFFKGT